ncbi:MAG: DUF927 domain-containing protein [Lachnospiraceae bacterium]|nr:DUF927 domain-containing protein [Lachnospiraceae bacterium]
MNVIELYKFAQTCCDEICHMKDGVLYQTNGDTEVLIADFIPVVKELLECFNVFSGECQLKIRVSGIIFQTRGDIESAILTKEKVLKISAIESIDFQADVDSHCYVDTSLKARRAIVAFMRKQISRHVAKRVLVADRLGHFNYAGHHGFVAGNFIYGNFRDEVIVDRRLSDFRLLPEDIKREYRDSEIEVYISRLFHFNLRIVPILFTANILAILKDAFECAGVPLKFSFFLKGEQSSGKTTLATLVCSFYNRMEDIEYHIHNLTATEAKLNDVLGVEKDMPIIIDDLRLSDSQVIMRKQEALLDNLIRVAANRVGKETLRYSYDINGFPIFLGEYALHNPSTNNRVIMLEFRKEELDRRALKDVSRNPEYLSCFLADFINWSLEHYDDIVDNIREKDEIFKEIRGNAEAYQERLQNHANALVTAYGIFLKYCEEKKWAIDFSMQQYQQALTAAIEDQIEELELEDRERPPYILLLYEIVRMYLDDEINCCCPTEKFYGQILYYDERHGLVYIPGVRLDRLLKEAGIAASKFDVMNDFEAVGLLRKDNNKMGVRTKKFKGIRCYVIDYIRWHDYVKEMTFRNEE